MENRKTQRGEDMSEPKITYEELMTEFEKHKVIKIYDFTPDQQQALVEARDKYNIGWDKIASIFSEKFGHEYDRRRLYEVYRRIKNH